MSENGRDHLTIRGSLDELDRVFLFIDGFCDAHQIDSETKHKLYLVVEELIVNTMNYGYGDGPAGLIDIRLERERSDVQVRIEDDAAPYNPLEAPDPVLQAALDDRPIGGLGVHLVKTLSRDVAYVFENGRNRLLAHISTAAS